MFDFVVLRSHAHVWECLQSLGFQSGVWGLTVDRVFHAKFWIATTAGI